MKFSVVIPLYNGEKLITKTLDSVAGQTYKDYEIVLVNDGSPDNVGKVVQEYIRSHPEIRMIYVEQKNKGLGGARNTAIKNSAGDVIALLDQDDIWYPEKLERVAAAYAKDPEADIVCHNYKIVNEDGSFVVVKAGPYVREMHRKLLFGGNCMGTPAVTFKRSVIERTGGFSEDRNNLHLLEDYEMWLRMALEGLRFVFMPDILAEFVYHGANFSHADARRVEDMCKSELFVIRLHFGMLKEKRPLDWYNYRRRRAVCLCYAANTLSSKIGDRAGALKYYLQCFVADPLYVFDYPLRKMRRSLMKNERK